VSLFRFFFFSQLSNRQPPLLSRAFNEWPLEHGDASFDVYERNFCLVADARAMDEILADVKQTPVLPEIDPGIKESVSTSMVVLDKRTPRQSAAQPDPEEEAESWEAEGQYDEKGYSGFIRCSLDDVAFLWGNMGNGDPQEVIYKYARKARKRPGQVFTYWHC